MDLLAASYHDSRRRPDRGGRGSRGDHEIEWSVRGICGSTTCGANGADGASSRHVLDITHSVKPSVDRIVALIGGVHERVAKWPWDARNTDLDLQADFHAYQVGAFDLRRLRAAHDIDRQANPEAQGAGNICALGDQRRGRGLRGDRRLQELPAEDLFGK